MRTVKQTIDWYRAAYDRLLPDNDSLDIANGLWSSWENEELSRPDVDKIHSNHLSYEEGFFKELVDHAANIANKDLNIAYCPFCIDEYNFSAFSAADGYLILVDDVFFQLLFFLTVLLVFLSIGGISQKEKDEVKSLALQMIETNYFSKKRFQFYEKTIVHQLMAKSYKLSEAANYLFQSFKVFILSHEIGHHVLGHTKGHMRQRFAIGGTKEEIEIDKRDIVDEFDADSFGCKQFLQLLDIRDESRNTFFLYRFEFAPLLFFDLCYALDRISEQRTGNTTAYETHPHPHRRIERLLEAHEIDEQNQLYCELKQGVVNLLIENEWKNHPIT